MKERKPNVRLTHQGYFQLTEWLRTNRERLTTERLLYAEAARQAAEAVGVETIAPPTFREAMKQTGVDWEPKTPTGFSVSGKNAQRIEVLEHQVEELKAQLTVLRGLIHHLYHSLGEKPPPGYILPTAENARLNVARPTLSAK